MLILSFLASLGCALPSHDTANILPDSGMEWEANPKSTVGTYGPVTMSSGTYINYRFTKYKGYTYYICADLTSGDIALYSDYRGYPTTKSYQYKSDGSGSSTECLTPIKATSTGYYYVSVYAKKKSTDVGLEIER
jgi:hypothetical protein